MVRVRSTFGSWVLVIAVLMLARIPEGPAAPAPVVEGEIALPDRGIKEPDVQHPGFIDRIPNPITELRPFDPRPECFVYLEGGPAAPDAATPDTKARIWELGGESFAVPLLPVVLGTAVDIKNVGKNTHPLFSPNFPDLVSKDPIGPGGVRTIQVKEPNKPVEIRSLDSPHLEGRIVAVPTRYFAMLDRRDLKGKWRISDVPPGKWTVRVWYRDGWLPINEVIEVGAKGTTTVRTITLPDRLEPKAPADPQKPN